uniref:PDZ domain-containing protein n=1 Tax=Oryza meridionalis TaxID=40149 RepID=A0A0E0DMC4_9ORYZ
MPPKPRRSVAALSVGGHDAPKSSPAMSTRSKSTPDSDLRSHDGNPSPGSWSGRLTRSRAKQIGLVLPIQAVESPGISSKNKKKRKRREIEEETAKEQAQMSAAATGVIHREGHGTLASRPLPPMHPPTTPRVRKSSRITRLEVDRLQKLTLRRDKDDPSTAAALPTPSHKNMVLGMSRSIVRVSSPPSEGKLISPRTGIVISWDGATKYSMILTLFTYFKKKPHEPQPELQVHLPDKSIVQGRLRFMNRHYNLSILEITSELPLQVPAFGSAPKYGQEILALSRDENMSLVARRGAITWSDGSLMWRNHYMFVDCDVPEGGEGGPVVDTGGSTIGMVYIDGPGAVIISISIICTFFEMWKQFSCVARPVFEVDLKSVELAGVSFREELSLKHNINGGFIVERIADDSALEHLGVRRGGVIFFDDECGTTLPEIEDYLLSLGWRYLQGMKSMVLKLLVHDIEGPCKETITLPLDGGDRCGGKAAMSPKRRKSVAALSDGPKSSPAARSTRSKSKPDSDLAEHDDSPRSSSGLTRSRAKVLKESAGVSSSKKKRRIEEESPAATTTTTTATTGVMHREGHGTLASRPLPPIHPPTTPRVRKGSRIVRLEVDRLQKLTLRRDKKDDPSTAAALPTPSDKNMVLGMSHSIVRVSSPPSSEGKLISPRTGFIISWDGATKRAMIVTLSTYFKKKPHEPQPELQVHLSDKSIVQGRLIFMNRQYNLSILEITSDLPLQVPAFGSAPKYGQKILALSRDENISLVARRGAITWSDGSFMWRNHYMFVDCDVPEEGLWLTAVGSSIAMVYRAGPGAVIISISIICTFFEMWKQFSCVARPVFDVDLRSVELAGVSLREELSVKHNINGGFMVKRIADDSALEHLGVRRGDVIFFEDECGTSLPEIEDYLLSLGWRYLQGMKSMVLKLLVHDIEGPCKETITLPLEFSVDSGKIEDYLLSLGWRYLQGMKSMVLKLLVHDIEGPCKETITLPLEFSVDSGKFGCFDEQTDSDFREAAQDCTVEDNGDNLSS